MFVARNLGLKGSRTLQGLHCLSLEFWIWEKGCSWGCLLLPSKNDCWFWNESTDKFTWLKKHKIFRIRWKRSRSYLVSTKWQLQLAIWGAEIRAFSSKDCCSLLCPQGIRFWPTLRVLLLVACLSNTSVACPTYSPSALLLVRPNRVLHSLKSRCEGIIPLPMAQSGMLPSVPHHLTVSAWSLGFIAARNRPLACLHKTSRYDAAVSSCGRVSGCFRRRTCIQQCLICPRNIMALYLASKITGTLTTLFQPLMHWPPSVSLWSELIEKPSIPYCMLL